ncbi:MAG: hypothetical protein COA42_05740 [Alteromonadaceae bacterium]|nr:MAG: hypothetical protein COA42_05740 [Alteromonadaceae bacterium]
MNTRWTRRAFLVRIAQTLSLGLPSLGLLNALASRMSTKGRVNTVKVLHEEDCIIVDGWVFNASDFSKKTPDATEAKV